MIDPQNITKYGQTSQELQEVLIFWILAAGKTAASASQGLQRVLLEVNGLHRPFKALSEVGSRKLPGLLKRNGIGCYRQKSKFIMALIESGIDLKSCSVDDLESIKGIGPKTARCFLLHSRPNQRYAGLDTHVLKFLRSKGYDVPKSTPTGKKYKELEQVFLSLADRSGKSVADFDLEIWKRYSKKKVAA